MTNVQFPMSKEVPMTNDQEQTPQRCHPERSRTRRSEGSLDASCAPCSMRALSGVRDPSLRVSTRSVQDDKGGCVTTRSVQDDTWLCERRLVIGVWSFLGHWTLVIGHSAPGARRVLHPVPVRTQIEWR